MQLIHRQLSLGLILFTFLAFPWPVAAFTFVAWGDTKSDINTLKNLSPQVKALSPAFTLYVGDLVDKGFAQPAMDNWKSALNGGTGNGVFDISFPVRGNHDSSSPSLWSSYFNFAGVATQIGATNYTELNNDLTYSFDYGNSRFLGIDVIGDASLLSSAQIAWIDARLSDAESKGLTHAFIYFHGPIYCVAKHCSCTTTTGCVSTAAVNLINVINKHPIVTATFHGHEHVVAYTGLNSTRIPQLSRELAEFVTGDAGAGPDTVKPNRTDYDMTTSDNKGGFLLVDVSGATVKAHFYRGSVTTPVHTVTLSKSPAPPPSSPTPSPSRTPLASHKPGDLTGDGKIDLLDFNLLISKFGNPYTLLDFNAIVTNYGK